MKKFLIVSYYYSPANIMGAIRASKLSKYLSKEGYDVTVICSKDNKLLFMPNSIISDKILERDTKNINKVYISHSRVYIIIANLLLHITKKIYNKSIILGNSNCKKNNNSQFSIKNVIKKTIHFFTFFFSLCQDYDFLNQCKRKIKCMDKYEYDVIISTYGPIASHFVGQYLKTKNKKSIWIADFRDPIAQPTNGILEYRFNKYIENRVCKNANIITAVSQGYLNEIIRGNKETTSYVISNGFDTEDLSYIDKPEKHDIFSFVYTGTTYGGKRDLTPIFRVLRELIDENKIKKNKIVFRYAGCEKSQVKFQAKKFNLEDIVESYDLIPRTEALQLNLKSHILVVSTWNDSKHTGVLPGKFLEYLMFNKPIIALINGNKMNSEISVMVDDYNLGSYYESINDNNDFVKLKEYILNQYEYFLKNGQVLFEPKVDKINEHDYKNISKKFVNILN